MRHSDEAVLDLASPPAPAGSPQILIIEDNDTNALILRCMLRKTGHQAVVANDGLEGVGSALRLRPSLILMDLHMPRLDGFAAAAQIRQSDGIWTPAIIAVTASAGPEIHAACLTSGFDAVLAKPLLLEALSEMVRRFLPSS